MVLGPDSTLAPVIAAPTVPLAAGSVEHAVALVGMLAVLSGAFSLLIGLARPGLVADLLSKPTRLGFMNAIALTALHGELRRQGIELWFAGMKGPVKDRLKHYGTLDLIGHGIFCPTVGQAVNVYRAAFRVDWKDWGEL